MPTIERQCNCKGTPSTDFQDKVYGKNIRIHNIGKEGKAAKCSCCGSTKSLGGGIK